MKRWICVALAVVLALLSTLTLAEQAKVATPGGTLNLRAEPTTKSKLIMRIPNRAKVTVVEHTNDEWTQISYKGKTGYVMTSYLDIINLEEGKHVYPDPGNIVYVREKPDEDAKVIGERFATQAMEVLEFGDTWTKVRYEGYFGDVVGYVLTQRIESGYEKPVENVGYALEEMGVMRSKQVGYYYPDKSSRAVVTLPKGTEVVVWYIDGAWCRVLADIYTCYVPTSSVQLTGEPYVESPISGVDNYVAVYYTATVPSGSLKLYQEPVADRDGAASTTVQVASDQQVTVVQKALAAEGETWAKVLVDGANGGWTLASALKISEKPTEYIYPVDVKLGAKAVVYAGPDGAKLYEEDSTLSKVLIEIPAGTELYGTLTWSYVRTSYGGFEGQVPYSQVVKGMAEVEGWDYQEHMNDAPLTPSPEPSPVPTPEDESAYITLKQARSKADAALKKAYKDFSAKNVKVDSERVLSKRGIAGPLYELAYYRNGQYVYNALVHAMTGEVVYTADYTDFARPGAAATPKPKATSVPGEISKSEARSAADRFLRGEYGSFDDVTYKVINERFESMPGYTGTVFRLNYYEKETDQFAYTCIVSAKDGSVLYHTEVWDGANTEIDYSTPTPAPEYESREDIGESRARSIADRHLGNKYPDFAGGYASVRSQYCAEESPGSFEKPYYQFDYFDAEGRLVYEVMVHAWTGKVLYSFGSLPGEGNG